MATSTAASQVRYNAVARTLHWFIGLLILFNLVTGMFGESMEKVWVSMPLHKATGLVILVLSFVRLGWRLSHVPPAYPVDFQPALRRGAADGGWGAAVDAALGEYAPGGVARARGLYERSLEVSAAVRHPSWRRREEL